MIRKVKGFPLYIRVGRDGVKTYYWRRTWMESIFENGVRRQVQKEVQRALGGDREGALRQALELTSEHEARRRGEPVRRDVALAEFVGWYVGHVRDVLKLASAETIVPAVTGFLKHAGDRPMRRITREDVESYLASRRGTVKPATLNSVRKNIRRLFAVAVERRYVPANPVDGVPLEKVPRVRAHVPSPEETARLLSILRSRHPWLADVTMLMIGTGARAGEALNVDWGAVSFGDGTVTLTRTKVTSLHTVSMEGPLKDMLWAKWQEAGMPRSGPVFAGPDGKPRQVWEAYSRFKRAARDAGIPWAGLHTCRRLAATVAVEATGEIRAAQELLGHGSSIVTERYIGRPEAARKRGAEATGRFLAAVTGGAPVEKPVERDPGPVVAGDAERRTDVQSRGF